MNNCSCGVDEVRPCRGHLNGMIFRFLVYADNIFLTTDSAAEAARRSCEEASVFKSQRLQFNESRLEILPSKATEKDSFSFGLEDGEPFTWVETLQVLGCFLDGTGSTETLAKGRLLQGRKIFNNVLPADPTGGTDPRVLLHGGCLCVVVRWLLGSVVEGAAAGLGPGKQMASMRLGEAQGA